MNSNINKAAHFAPCPSLYRHLSPPVYQQYDDPITFIQNKRSPKKELEELPSWLPDCLGVIGCTSYLSWYAYEVSCRVRTKESRPFSVRSLMAQRPRIHP
ncbi:hypothetical protein DJ90_6289 [Paenibacillus macerans]|uniref:Uncharacterized protein n=1 Tax=Paenibacillus macerans TaxID=44252 RepID=A0A090XUZ1_PAEMA|nr:hypothetical protein DJ90_6289 [Paenibacillus macerans]